MANNLTDRAATAAAGSDALFPVEVSLGEAGVECRRGTPKLGTDAFSEQCRSLDRRPPLHRFAKRLFDLVFSVCVIVVGFIPGLVLSLAIVADTKGSPIYSQTRIGRLGRTFRIYKFRTMVADSDDVEKYLDAEQLAQWHRERKVDDDPRITPLGRKLRRLSLDEMPNFLNVLKGDIPSRILKTRQGFSLKKPGAFALPANVARTRIVASLQVKALVSAIAGVPQNLFRYFTVGHGVTRGIFCKPPSCVCVDPPCPLSARYAQRTSCLGGAR